MIDASGSESRGEGQCVFVAEVFLSFHAVPADSYDVISGR